MEPNPNPSVEYEPLLGFYVFTRRFEMSDTSSNDWSNETLGTLHMTGLSLIAATALTIACWAGLT